MNLTNAPEHLKNEAEELSKKYTVEVKPHGRLFFVGSVKELPTVVAHGPTEAKCTEATRKAAMIVVLTMLVNGQETP
jgi:predicted RNase H-like HicB family nuclease